MAALPGGGALLMGGNTSESLNVPDTDTTDRFDPITERISRGPSLAFTAESLEFTSVAPLTNGSFVLVGGGINGGAIGSRDTVVASQRFDLAAGAFVRIGDLHVRRFGDMRATDLGDGGALVTGSFTVPAVAAAERLDSTTGQWSRAADMRLPRREHTATRLSDGRVLFAGGYTCCVVTPTTATETPTAEAEIYDPLDRRSPWRLGRRRHRTRRR